MDYLGFLTPVFINSRLRKYPGVIPAKAGIQDAQDPLALVFAGVMFL